MLRHPIWLGRLLSDGIPRLGTVSAYPGLGRWAMEQASRLGQQIDPRLTWESVRWLRDTWKGRLVIKGVMSADDARRALDNGADGLMVSNHGGRQLDPGASRVIAMLRAEIEASLILMGIGSISELRGLGIQALRAAFR